MTFDVSPYSGDIISGGTLTITDAGLFVNNNNGQVTDSLDTSLSVYSLSASYDPNNGTLADVPYSPATLLDTESYSVPTTSSQIPLTFDISSALLEQWANAPSSNYGFIVVESGDFTYTGVEHSDLGWIASGQGAPVLSFHAAPSPEPATLLLIARPFSECASWVQGRFEGRSAEGVHRNKAPDSLDELFFGWSDPGSEVTSRRCGSAVTCLRRPTHPESAPRADHAHTRS